MKNSRIEWTDHTFNPWIGCTEVSSGCDNCYARETFDGRRKMVRWGACQPRHRTSLQNWHQPYVWNQEAQRSGTHPRVFCASLADVFDSEVDDLWRSDLFTVIDDCRDLKWLILTKRLDNACEFLDMLTEAGWPWPHVWIGASVETQAQAAIRIPALIQIPAAGRFLSIEPMLGPMTVQYPAIHDWMNSGHLIGVDWVIAGGESGKLARPTHPNWIRAMRDQCQHDGRPFFFKGWGEWASLGGWPGGRLQPFVFDDGLCVHRVGRSRSGCFLDGIEHKEVPTCLS